MKDIKIYTDGSTKTNPGIGAWGTIIVEPGDWTDSERIMTKCYRRTTNNRMELLGFIEPLRELVKQPDASDLNVEVVSDSQYAVKAATEYIPSWKSKGWKTSTGKPIKNKDLIIELDDITRLISIKFTWIKGHNGHPYNERCDLLAKAATDQAEKAVDLEFENSEK